MVKIEAVCRLLSDSFSIPVFSLDEQAVSSFQQDFLIELKPSAEEPTLASTPYLEQFFFFLLPNGQTLVTGPCLHENMNDVRLSGLMNDLNARQEQRADYYRQLPVVSKKQWRSMARLAYFIVHGKERDVCEQTANVAVENSDLHVSRRKQSMSFHHDPSHEQKLMAFIRKGNVREVKKIMQTGLEDGGEFGVLSKTSYVRSQKNLAIASITLATRAAIDGGVHPEMAYTLSDVYIQRLEELTEVKQVERLFQDALCAFTERVQRAKNLALSSVIVKCQRYMTQRIYEPVTLEGIAHYVELSPSYVSTLFKNETGLTVSEAIQKARVEEAESLLMFSSHPIAVISAWLQFTDQSHFTKVFKKHTGMTPKQYRQSLHT